MRTSLRLFWLSAALVLWAAVAGAQTSGDATRPATPTFSGDTGLWFVPTAEVLPSNKISVSGYMRGDNYYPGLSAVRDFTATFAWGIKDKAELFGSFNLDTRVRRDTLPVFPPAGATNLPDLRSFITTYPFVRSNSTGNKLGDLSIGFKSNLWSQYRKNPVALALRVLVKLPTGDDAAGVSTGKLDSTIDFVLSKETTGHLEGAGYIGAIIRGKPDGFSAYPRAALGWGVGVDYPSRAPLRMTFELNGQVELGDDATLTGALTGTDGSTSLLTAPKKNLTRGTAGLTWQHRSGFFIGAGGDMNLPLKSSKGIARVGRDFWDLATLQLRIGYHPGVRVYVPPPPPPPPPPPTFVPAPPPPPPANRAPTIQSTQCEPCEVEVGKTATLTANATDPDGDPLQYRWSAPTGTFQNPAARQTVWTAPNQPGTVQVTVNVSDGRGGTTPGVVTMRVVAPPPPPPALTFEDVYFEFDRSTLRPEALRLLDDAITRMQANPTRNILIEGHTCNIGTSEYNLALGERRASSVRDYLISRGISASRLQIRSYGEEQPKFDNSKEETRRLNRRAVLTVSVQ